MRKHLVSMGLIFGLGLMVGMVVPKVWKCATYEEPLQWQTWWQQIETQVCQGRRFSLHTKSVVEHYAKQYQVTPDLVLLISLIDDDYPGGSQDCWKLHQLCSKRVGADIYGDIRCNISWLHSGCTDEIYSIFYHGGYHIPDGYSYDGWMSHMTTVLSNLPRPSQA